MTAPSPQEIELQRARLQAALGPAIEVRGLIGRGGFADVFAAWDVRLRRELAVKVLRTELTDRPDVLDRFQREAQAIAALRHPNIVPIYAVGDAEDLAFFTMPRVSGETLASVLDREGRLEPGEAARIIRETASALAEAHRHGIVHRDVKPDNIMLEGAERRVLVMDFGIAKSTLPRAAGPTVTGVVIGTPQYMSPEQAAGDRDVDGRSDQYSLAMMGYRMLAGTLPFAGESAQQVIFRQMTETPARLATVATDTPLPVSDAIARALAKDPAERFATIEEFAAPFALVGGASASVRRRQLTLAERAATMRAELPGWRHPIVLAGALGVLLTALLFRAITPRPGFELAAQREQAAAAATAAAEQFGARPPFDVERTAFPRRQPLYQFLQDALGRDSADARARVDAPVWRWRFDLDDATGQRWIAEVAPGPRVTLLQRALEDSAARPDLGADSARQLARAALARTGRSTDALRAMPEALVTRPRRVDRVFTWEDPAKAIVRGSDTAHARLRATVSGSDVISVEYAFDPPALDRTVLTALRPVAWGIALLALMALAVAVITLAISRQRRDTFDWTMATRFVGGAWLVLLGPGLLRSDDVLGTVFILVLGAGCTMAGVAVSESLAAEQNPRLFQGLGDAARSRLSPELATAAGYGLPIGLFVIGLMSLIMYLGTRVLHLPLAAEPAPLFKPPAIEPMAGQLSAVAVGAAGLVSMMMIARHLRIPGAIVAVPVVWSLLALFPTGRIEVLMALSITAGTLIGALTAWRYGLLAALIAVWIATGSRDLVTLMIFGGAKELDGALLAGGLLLLPVVAGWLAFRRFSPNSAR